MEVAVEAPDEDTLHPPAPHDAMRREGGAVGPFPYDPRVISVPLSETMVSGLPRFAKTLTMIYRPQGTGSRVDELQLRPYSVSSRSG